MSSLPPPPPLPLPEDSPRFFCDAMLGGLARWLRASGYEAEFEHGIPDARLVEVAGSAGGILLSSDRPLFDRRPMRSGAVRGLFVPRHAPVLDQTAFVLRTLSLPLRAVRCMRCGGALVDVPRDEAAREAPPRSLAAFDSFWRCDRCARLYWHGTHWSRIEAAREEIAVRIARTAG